MNKFIYRNFIVIVFITLFFSSCRLYYPNRMFNTKHNIIVDSLQKQANNAEKNYTIQKSDYLMLQVYTNAGEILIDPNNALLKKDMGGKASEPIRYLVRSNGYVNLPMIGDVYLNGYTVHQADSVLSIEYEKFYKEVFVKTKLVNKKVIVLGPPSGGTNYGGRVILLEDENVNLIEIIALFGGISDQGKAYNIRLIRGDLRNPQVTIIDLSTIEGMKAASLNVQPNDIIYIEPVRPIISVSFREISPLISLVATVATLIILFKK
jgi:polysaccharide biosynthesis/export protein